MPDPHMPALEQVIRDLLTDNPDLPIRASFYRGPGEREEADTPAVDPSGWFVMLSPHPFDVTIAAAGRWEWGAYDVIGNTIEVQLPQTEPGVVNVEALTSSRLRITLVTAIRSQAAFVAQTRDA